MTIDWSAFIPWSASIGGVVIGLAAALFVLVNGRVAGISGIVGGMLGAGAADFAWRLAFVAGLVLAPVAYAIFAAHPSATIEASYPVLIVAVDLVAHALARRRPVSVVGLPTQLPFTRTIDARLVGGSLLFGIGWGLAGFCPGPAIVALGAG